MGAPLNDESKRLLRLLDDREWHDLEAVKEKLATMVAPGKALRKYEEKSSQYHTRYQPRVGPELSDDDKILSGQKLLAYGAVRSMKKNYVEIREVSGPDGGAQVRLRPGVNLDNFLPPKPEKDSADAPPLDEPPPVSPEPPLDQSPPAVEPEPAAASPEPPADEPGPAPVMPMCSQCGLYIANQAQHEEFHRQRTPSPQRQSPPDVAPPPHNGHVVCAFFSEEQVKVLVRTEVEKALDAFQRGMQGWLVHRFAALEAIGQSGPRSSRNPDAEHRQRTERRRW